MGIGKQSVGFERGGVVWASSEEVHIWRHRESGLGHLRVELRDIWIHVFLTHLNVFVIPE